MKLKRRRKTRYGISITSGWVRVSSINLNENGTMRMDVDFYNNKADFDNGESPLDSEQYNDIAVTQGLNNQLIRALKTTNIDK